MKIKDIDVKDIMKFDYNENRKDSHTVYLDPEEKSLILMVSVADGKVRQFGQLTNGHLPIMRPDPYMRYVAVDEQEYRELHKKYPDPYVFSEKFFSMLNTHARLNWEGS